MRGPQGDRSARPGASPFDAWPAGPLQVEGGLTARSTRGAIGSSWWSKRFIAVLESFGAGGRLTRGRAYARKGQVLSLDLTPGAVRGQVQGSRTRPYDVWITIKVLPDEVWRRVESAMSEQALFAAQLLGGELPAGLEGVVAQAGGSLFPASFDDLSMRCTCPDWGLPCKHLAAAFYLLAEMFDDDPFRILQWRGRSREQFLAGIGVGAGPNGATGSGGATAVSSATELADLPTTPVEELLDRFWVSPVPLPGRPPTLDAPVDVLLRQLPGAPPALGGARLATALDDAYRRLGRSPSAAGP